MATLEEIRTVAPELASVPDDRLSYFEAIAARQLRHPALGEQRNYAVSLLVAHLLTQTNVAKEGAGLVASKSVGRVSVSFLAPQVGMSSWSTTVYGQMLLSLLKTIPQLRGPFTTAGGY